MSSEPPTSTSLVVATFGREAELACCLGSLCEVRGVRFEVIVVDQNSDDRVERVIASRSWPFPTKYLKVDYANASRARNDGARMAKGEWLGFPDDDCQYRPDTLQRLQNAVRDATVTMVSCAIADASGIWISLLEDEGARCIGLWSLCHPRRNIAESGLFVRHDVFSAIGGFSEQMGPGTSFPGGEGLDLALRAIRKYGGRCLLGSRQIVIEHPRPTPLFWKEAVSTSQIDRCYVWSIGDAALLWRHFIPAMWVRYSNYLIRSCLAAILPPSARRRLHRARLSGFFEGCRLYWRGTE